MNNQSNLEQIKELINKANNIYVLLAKDASGESLISALSLQQALVDLKKSVSIYSQSEQVEKISFVEESTLIRQKILPQEIIISLGCSKENIEKVSYDSKEGQFNLVVTPKEENLDLSQMNFRKIGEEPDLLIVIGVSNLEDLGELYKKLQSEFSEKKVINLDNHEGNGYFGSVNLVDTSKATIAEILLSTLGYLEIPFQEKVTDLLLLGIYLGTSSFQDRNTNSQTFLAVSKLLEKGANLKKVHSDYEELKEQQVNGTSKPKPNQAKEKEDHFEPTPFVKNEESQMEIEKPPIFQKNQAQF